MESTTVARCAKDKKHTRGRWKSLSYTCKIWSMIFTCIALVAAAMVLLYFLLIKNFIVDDNMMLMLPTEILWVRQCSSTHNHSKVDCFPENGTVNPDLCIARGCCYENLNMPKCFYPENYGYNFRDKVQTTPGGFEVSLTRLPAPSRYGDDINQVNVLVEMQTPYRLHVKFYDPASRRYQVPTPKIPTEESVSDGIHRTPNLYSVIYNESVSPFALKIIREETDTVLYDTSIGALTLSHRYLELLSRLPSSNIYGFGGKNGANNSTTMNFFANPTSKINGVHPAYVCMEKEGSSHGVLLLNSNALEIKLLSTPAITFRTIGGVLDFYIFLGPTPEDVVMQYTEAVGRPFLPPYWALGLQFSYTGFYPIEDIEKSIQHFASKSIPLEVLTCDNLGLENYYKGAENHISLLNIERKLHEKNQKFMLAVRPTIEVEDTSTWNSIYKNGLRQKAFIFDNWAIHPLRGKIGGKQVVYPDYGQYSTDKWWTDALSKLYRDLKFDGLWLVDNSPRSEVDGGINGCMNDDLNRSPYVPGSEEKPLYFQTLCMDSIQHLKDKAYRHYDLHNLYGHTMVKSTEQSIKGLDSRSRKLLVSSSTFVGTGRYAGHLMNGINATWEGLRTSIAMLLDFSLNGISFVANNMCGDGNTKIDEELCLRQIQLGAFYPISQIQNFKINMFDNFSESFLDSFRHAISLRYKLLPFLYTLFYLAHVKGSTVMRPLFNEFPKESDTHSIKSQFMWGSTLLVSPTLKQGAVYQEFYLPGGVWYDFYSGEMTVSPSGWFNHSTVLYSEKPVLLHIRGGHMVVLQTPSNTTKDSRNNPMTLIVALNETLQAEGFLFWDDGELRDSILNGEYISVQFLASETSLQISGSTRSKMFRTNIYIEHLQILGLRELPKSITINDNYLISRKQKHWHFQTRVLDIHPILIPLEGTTHVKWKFSL